MQPWGMFLISRFVLSQRESTLDPFYNDHVRYIRISAMRRLLPLLSIMHASYCLSLFSFSFCSLSCIRALINKLLNNATFPGPDTTVSRMKSNLPTRNPPHPPLPPLINLISFFITNAPSLLLISALISKYSSV